MLRRTLLVLLGASLLATTGAARPTARATPNDAAVAPVPAAGRIEERTFYSVALGRTMPYALYLPPGYREAPATRRYPVLYLLHGRGEDHTAWPSRGVREAADALIAAGEIAPLLIVMPEGEAAYWTDHADGGPRWGSYVADDLVAAIDAALPTLPTREARAIGGNSMGAHGALQLALRHPDRFSIVGAHSLALRDHRAAPPFFGNAREFAERDPTALVAAHPAAARALRLALDIGIDDGWRDAATAFHAQLTREEIPHAWLVAPGGHSVEYWSGRLPDYLRYYGDALGQAEGHFAARPAGG